MRSYLPAGGLGLMLSTAIVAQTTHVVTGGGLALQAAIQAAAPGDILDVWPGSYTAVTCSKGLHIALRAGAEVGTTFSLIMSLVITAVPSQEACVVTGGKVNGLSVSQCAGTVVIDGVAINAFLQNPPMDVADCAGPIVFDGVDYTTPPGLAYGLLQVTNSAHVSFTDCKLPTMTVSSSAVSLQNPLLMPYGFGSGLHLQSGSVTVSGGRILGAQTASWPVAQPGILLDQGTLTLTGATSIEPSPAGLVVLPTPGIRTTGGTIRRDPGASVLGLPIAGPATVTITPIPSLAITHTSTAMNVAVAGEAGSAVFTFGGLPTPAYPTPWGEAWLLPTDPILDVAILPPTGTTSFARNFGAVPPGFVLVVQSIALRPNGALAVGAPARFAWN